MITTTAREQVNAKQLLDQLKKAVPSGQGLVLTTAPRGGLQVMQPATVFDAFVKSYNNGFHAEDRLTWQVVMKGKPARLEDCWSKKELEATPYYREWMEPAKLAHVVAVPLAAPALDGYPGAIHLCRTAEQGEFSDAEVDKLADLAAEFDQKLAAARASRHKAHGPAVPGVARPNVRFAIMDRQLRSKTPGGAVWSELDERLREQISEQAKRRHHQLNGDSTIADRLLLSDSHGDHWPFRVVTFKRYPALGEGPYSFFCLQPDCREWGVVKPTDFQADTEMSRLIPALRFMQQEFHRGPTLVEIAKTVELSPFHFHRRFTELLGLTPKQFLLECQIHLAKVELLAREKELVQIAKECGFAHQSHFTSRFKQATGLTPTRWRRMASERGKGSDN